MHFQKKIVIRCCSVWVKNAGPLSPMNLGPDSPHGTGLEDREGKASQAGFSYLSRYIQEVHGEFPQKWDVPPGCKYRSSY